MKIVYRHQYFSGIQNFLCTWIDFAPEFLDASDYCSNKSVYHVVLRERNRVFRFVFALDVGLSLRCGERWRCLPCFELMSVCASLLDQRCHLDMRSK